MKVYLLAALGCDQSLFDRVTFPDSWETVFIPWPEPGGEKDLGEYAFSMAKGIDRSEPFMLLGVSMGGMVAMEMAQFLKPEKVILVSSAKHAGELPSVLKILRYLPLHLVFPMRYLYRFASLANRQMGLHTSEAKNWFKQSLRRSSPHYLRFCGSCDRVVAVETHQSTNLAHSRISRLHAAD